MTRLVAVLSIVAVVFAVSPAAADHGDIHPTFRQERTYFQCQSQQVKVDNVQATQGTLATWSTTAPAGAFLGQGDGCGSFEPTARSNGGVALDTQWKGSFTGNLTALTVEIHDLSHRARTPLGPNANLIATLWVDDEQLITGDVKPAPIESSTGASHSYKFSLANLGLASEEGDGTQVRNYRLELRARDANIWAWGASEVPSGITFNPPTLEATQLAIEAE
jgi:hypothetical protein